MADRRGKPSREQAGITTHPLFPAIVALWFSALFGLGSLVVRPSLFEALVLRFQIDTLVPAAAPPLGLTARILIALALAALGGVLGAVLARRIARPKSQPVQRKRGAAAVGDIKLRTRDAHDDAPARRPILAHDEIGEGIAEPGPADATIPGRRRSLTVDPQEPEPYSVPLPGLEIAEAEIEPLELGVFEAVEPDPEPDPEPAPRQIFGQGLPAAADAEFDSILPSQPEEPDPQALSDTQTDEGGDPAAEQNELEALDLAALTERFAQALRLRRERAASVPPPPPPAAAPVETGPLVLPSFAESAQVQETPVPLAPMALPAALRPLELGDDADDEDDYASLLPLRSIAMPPALAAVPEAAPEPDAASFGSAPQAMQPRLHGFHERMNGIVPAENSEVAGDTEEVSTGYRSLFEANRPAAPRQEFVRIEDPVAGSQGVEPVVVFPGQAARASDGHGPDNQHGLASPQAPADFSRPPMGALRRFDAPSNAVAGQSVSASAGALDHDPEETERALRAALGSLQRISGVA